LPLVFVRRLRFSAGVTALLEMHTACLIEEILEMASSGTGENFKFNSTASYRICVKGFLDESWSERFNGMKINNQVNGEFSPMTALVGTLGDQTALIGVLNSIYELHLPVVSVELLGSDDEVFTK
jgi:hypothetical protein